MATDNIFFSFLVRFRTFVSIVPNGMIFYILLITVRREVDWMFSCDEGRLQLAESAGVERLVVVTMHRGHTYSSLEDVKEEVSAKAMELIQSDLPPGKNVSQ